MRKGSHLNIEHRKKLSEAHKGKLLSIEHRLKISESNKGKVMSDISRLKISNSHKGKPLSESHKKAISKAHTGKKYESWMIRGMKGKIHTLEWKKKASERMKGNTIWRFSFKSVKRHDTFIEKLVEQELIRRGINYKKQYYIDRFCVDFYLPESKTIIECDGDYWHTRYGAKTKDSRKTSYLLWLGYNVYRFWEHDIKESVEKCIDKIQFNSYVTTSYIKSAN